MEEKTVSVHTDGGARGNPGPGACAFTIEVGGKIFLKGTKFLGPVTNNYAEYQGVILALNKLLKEGLLSGHTVVSFFLDSELVVRQLSGVYKVKDQTLRKLFVEIFSLISKGSSKVTFQHVPRSKNKMADLLVNRELDRH